MSFVGRARRASVLAALVLIAAVPAPARACGQCVEDKIAATYDAAVCARASRAGHVVVYTEVRGPAAGGPPALRDFVLHTLAAIPGVDPGTVRVSLEPPAAAFACDAHRHAPAALLSEANARLAGRRLSLALITTSASRAPSVPAPPQNRP